MVGVPENQLGKWVEYPIIFPKEMVILWCSYPEEQEDDRKINEGNDGTPIKVNLWQCSVNFNDRNTSYIAHFLVIRLTFCSWEIKIHVFKHASLDCKRKAWNFKRGNVRWGACAQIVIIIIVVFDSYARLRIWYFALPPFSTHYSSFFFSFSFSPFFSCPLLLHPLHTKPNFVFK